MKQTTLRGAVHATALVTEVGDGDKADNIRGSLNYMFRRARDHYSE
jgi:hypothetical protein